MEFEEHEEHEEEMDLGASYDSLANSAARVKISSETGPEVMVNQSTSQTQQHLKKPRYRECLKNHAVGLGGHALDGCGEFMPAGAEGTLDALQCAACNCHRNFHRKETEPVGSGHGTVSMGEPYGVVPSHQYQPQPHPHPHPQFSSPYYGTPAGYLHVAQHHRPLALPSTSGGGGGSHSREDQEDVSNPRGGVGGGGSGFVGSSKKRFRTKFTQEQKDGMLSLAERLGWRIQKENEAEVQQFCNETGVKRQVLKVWMHNNKNTLGKKP